MIQQETLDVSKIVAPREPKVSLTFIIESSCTGMRPMRPMNEAEMKQFNDCMLKFKRTLEESKDPNKGLNRKQRRMKSKKKK